MQCQGHVWGDWILQSNCVYGSQKSPQTSQLWDRKMALKQGYVFVKKIFPHMCAYIVISAESGIGMICGSHWSTHETAHVKPLCYLTLVLHWAHPNLYIKSGLVQVVEWPRTGVKPLSEPMSTVFPRSNRQCLELNCAIDFCVLFVCTLKVIWWTCINDIDYNLFSMTSLLYWYDVNKLLLLELLLLLERTIVLDWVQVS